MVFPINGEMSESKAGRGGVANGDHGASVPTVARRTRRAWSPVARHPDNQYQRCGPRATVSCRAEHGKRAALPRHLQLGAAVVSTCVMRLGASSSQVSVRWTL